MAIRATAESQIGSHLPDTYGKFGTEYRKLFPKKVLPGAQANFILLLVTETQYGKEPKRSKKRTVKAWAEECNCEDRQATDVIYDALDKGLVCSYPAIPKGQPKAARLQTLEFYLPPPEAWEKVPDVPKPKPAPGPKLLKASVTPISRNERLSVSAEPDDEVDDEVEDDEAGEDEANEPAVDCRFRGLKARTIEDLELLPKVLLSREFLEPCRRLTYDNETGENLKISEVRERSGTVVVRIYRTTDNLQSTAGSAPTSTNAKTCNGLQVPELTFDRKELRSAVNTRLASQWDRLGVKWSLPDKDFWSQVCKNMGAATPNEALLDLIDAKIEDNYPVKTGLLLGLAEQAKDEFESGEFDKRRARERAKITAAGSRRPAERQIELEYEQFRESFAAEAWLKLYPEDRERLAAEALEGLRASGRAAKMSPDALRAEVHNLVLGRLARNARSFEEWAASQQVSV